jgi:hypothetical protein
MHDEATASGLYHVLFRDIWVVADRAGVARLGERGRSVVLVDGFDHGSILGDIV